MNTWFKQTWHELATELFDEDGLTTVFTHARNVVTGAAVIAAGLFAAHHLQTTAMKGMWTVHFAGYAVAALGGVLLALNLMDGLRRLARRKHHLLLRIAAILVYVGLSVRLTQVVIYFRSAI
jgi:hypothetical protein